MENVTAEEPVRPLTYHENLNFQPGEAAMPVLLSMLRGVNVGSHNRIKMDALRALYESLKLENPRTYVQSGNVIFRTKEKSGPLLVKKIQDGIEKKFGCRPEVILRTAAELRRAIEATPFAKERDLHPGKILVTFLSKEPSPEVAIRLDDFSAYKEELHLKRTRTLYLFSRRGGKVQAAMVSGREAAQSHRYSPELEQRHEHVSDV